MNTKTYKLFSCLPTYSTSQVNVLWLYCNTFCVDGTKLCIFKQFHKVCLAGFLKSQYCGALKLQIFNPESIHYDLSHKSIEEIKQSHFVRFCTIVYDSIFLCL